MPAHIFVGFVSLPLKCAQVLDTDGLGEAYFEDGCPPNDSREESLARRRACYQCIVDALKDLDAAADAAEAAGQPQKGLYNPFETRSLPVNIPWLFGQPRS